MKTTLALPSLVLLVSLLATADHAVAQQTEAAKLFQPRPFHDPTSFTGRAVDISNEWALVGDYAHIQGGQVYFFQRGPTGWRFRQTLRGPESNFFGSAVTIDGETAAVGAWTWPFPEFRGRAFVYDYSDGQWGQSQVLAPVPLSVGSLFGHAVALCGDVLIVGAPGSAVPSWQAGEVFIYERIAGLWTQVERLQQPPISDVFNFNFKNFGLCVAVDGDVMVAGAPGITGAVYVYERGAGGWTRTALLLDPTPTKNDAFGFSVGISGDRIVVGEPALTGSPYRPGSAFVFERNLGGSWVLQKEIRPSDGFFTQDFGDEFGNSVDIDGDRIVVGMPHGRIQGFNTGTGYLFVRDENGWPNTETQRLIAADSSGKSDILGEQVAISGGFMIAGAIGAWVGDKRHGAAYVFEVELGQTYCDGNPNSTGVPARLTATGSLRVTDQDLTLSVRQCPKNSLGIFLMSASRTSLPLGDGVLCLGSPFRRLLPPLVMGSGGKAMYDLDFGDPSIAGSLLAGSTWTFQFWYLDSTGGPGGQNLSNAIALTLE